MKKLSKPIAMFLCIILLFPIIATTNHAVEASYNELDSVSVQAKTTVQKHKAWFIITFVRAEASPFGTVVDILFMNDTVTIISESSFYSYVKTSNGTNGYVFSGLLTSSTKSNSAFSINDYINVYTGKTKTVTVKGVTDSDLLSWSVGDNNIISFDPQTKKLTGLNPGTTTLTVRKGLLNTDKCVVTVINQWNEVEFATSSKQVTIKKSPGDSYGTLATLSKGKSITARGDLADGSGWIYISASDDAYWGFIKLSDYPGIDYLMTEYHYYDKGFDKRFSSASTKIYDYASVLNNVMLELFNLKVCPYVEPYTSLADNCKILSSGSVTSDNLAKACPETNGHGVGDESLCLTTKAIRNQLLIDKLSGTDIATKAVWTGHIMNGHKSSTSEFVTKTLVFTTANTVKYDSKTGTYTNRSDDKIRYYSLYEITHETGHQLGLKDGYCYGDITQGHCSNANCFLCNGQKIPDCIMSKIKDPENDSRIFCENCKTTIKNHLKNHH